jgi:ligand-binding sensor domain-containing protein/signal transduction histidine kinase
MNFWVKSLFFTARIFLVAAVLLARTPGPASAQSSVIRFETLSVEDGLSQSTVRAIIQDGQGFMWFGTGDGLNKYDGYTFTHYKHDPENPASISDSLITSIYLDSQGQMWVGTASGLDRYAREDETFEHFLAGPGPANSTGGTPVSAIVEDRSGNLWFGASDSGLRQLNRVNGEFLSYRQDPGRPDTLVSDQVTALASDQSGGVWIGTVEGLDYFDPASGKFTHYRQDAGDPRSLSSNQVSALLQDRSGILWVGTEDGGLNRFNPSTQVFTRYQPSSVDPRSISSRDIRTIYEDKDGRLWIGGRNGINLFDRDTGTFTRYQRSPGDPNGLANDYVLSIHADRSGVLWFGTFGGGLSKYVQANERFTIFQPQPNVANSLSSDIVYAVLEDRLGVVWVGTMDGGLYRIDPETGAFTSLTNDPSDTNSLANNDVRALLEDRNGMIWIGTYGGGLNRYDPRSGRFTRYLHNPDKPDSLSDSRITALREDRAGNLWVGTRGGGLNKLDPQTGQFTQYLPDPSDPASLSGEYVQAMYEDSEGKLWTGTYDGISVLDPQTGRFTRYQNDPGEPASLSNNRVLSFYEAPDGTMWIGTLLGGLNRFDRATQTFQAYHQQDGLPDDAVYGILGDQAGYLWLSTNRGLSRFDSRTQVFRNYDRRDGLQSTDFSPGAYFQNRQGWMYFGGVQGFITFDPSRVRDNPVAPPVVITAFKKFNQIERKDLTGQATVTLSYQDNFISFEFAALDFTAPEKNQYAYKLEGFDKDWIEAGTRRYASYTNLRGGTYVFRVMGSNPDGVWNTTGAEMEIVVVPPLWERWWFIGTVALILLGSAAGGYRLRIMRIQAQNRQLEEQVRERTKEAERRREVAEGLREILTILNSNRSLKESLDAIILQVMVLVETQAVAIFRCEDPGYPVILASNLPKSGAEQAEKGLPGLPDWITGPILRGQTAAYPDLVAYRPARPGDNDLFSPFAALYALPLQFNDRVEGGLILLFTFVRYFGEEDWKIAAGFADHAALAIANAELRSQAEVIAVSAERSRLARDLHDAVTQTLFATSLIAEVLPRLWERNPQAAMLKVAEIRELTRGALAEMRTLLMELRPTALEDVPLTDLLQQLSEAFTGRARVPVELDLDHTIELPSAVKIGFYRIAQEALNNVQKHARATQVCIRLGNGDGQVGLSILDNGVGFDKIKTSPDHFGLGIMEERAQTVGARFEVESQAGAGTRVSVLWTNDN